MAGILPIWRNNQSIQGLGHLPIVLVGAVNSLVINASITHFNPVEERPRENKILFKQLKFFDFRMKCVVLPYSGSYSEETKCI